MASGPLGRGIQYAAEDRVATAAVQVMLGGKGAVLMAAAIMISTFGCINGMGLAGARVYYAMAKDGLFFRAVGKVDSKHHTPAISLVVQAGWAALLTLSGTYSDLLDYVVFAVVLFYALTIAGVFRLRRTRPEAPAGFPQPKSGAQTTMALDLEEGCTVFEIIQAIAEALPGLGLSGVAGTLHLPCFDCGGGAAHPQDWTQPGRA